MARLRFRPLTPDRFPDLETLFGPRGACGGCWCMWWRLKRSEFERRKGSKNKRALKSLVDSGHVPGLLAYSGSEPVGWVAVAPRESYPVLGRSRILKPVDSEPVWSVTCFYVAKSHRRRGMSVALIRAAMRYAAKRGAHIVEGYPVEPRKESIPDVFAWTGLSAAFHRAGFREVLRRSPTRPIVRHAGGTGSSSPAGPPA